MRHLVIGQRQKAPNFSAFPWSPHGCLITIGLYFVTTRVVHLPKRIETSLITESDQSRANYQLLQLCTVRTAWSDSGYCSYARSAQPGPIRTRLCGPCIAAKAGYYCCCDAKFGKTSADIFHKFSSPSHNSMNFSISVVCHFLCIKKGACSLCIRLTASMVTRKWKGD